MTQPSFPAEYHSEEAYSVRPIRTNGFLRRSTNGENNSHSIASPFPEDGGELMISTEKAFAHREYRLLEISS